MIYKLLSYRPRDTGIYDLTFSERARIAIIHVKLVRNDGVDVGDEVLPRRYDPILSYDVDVDVEFGNKKVSGKAKRDCTRTTRGKKKKETRKRI